MKNNKKTAFTLTEVAISLMIVVMVVLVTLMLLTGALRDQQINRYRILAAAKAVTILELFTQPAEDFASGSNDPSFLDLQLTRKLKARPSSGFDATAYIDYGPTGIAGRNDLENQIGTGLGGAIPVPPELARRLDSPNDEIRKLIDQGAYIYYFDPTGPAGEQAGNAAISNQRNLSDDSLQKIVFAVIGPPQHNTLPLHPTHTQNHLIYPFPPQINRTSHLAWNLDRSDTATYDFTRESGKIKVFGPRTSKDNKPVTGYYGILNINAPSSTSITNVRDALSSAGNSEQSTWEWHALNDVLRDTTITTEHRERILQGTMNAYTMPTGQWRPNSQWSPWVAGLPEMRRLFHWHWRRIASQTRELEIKKYSAKKVPKQKPIYESRSREVTETVTSVDVYGMPHTRDVTKTITEYILVGYTTVLENSATIDTTFARGLPTPPMGLARAKGLRGTDIPYVDHETIPYNRFEQFQAGMPNLERRVMYRTAALALWAKVSGRAKKTIMTASPDTLGEPIDISGLDPNVADRLDPAITDLDNLALAMEDNPLITRISPPQNPNDIHPAQVLALSHLAHAAMMVTGYQPPFTNTKNEKTADKHEDLTKDTTLPYRYLSQETYYLIDPMYSAHRLEITDKNSDEEIAAKERTSLPYAEGFDSISTLERIRENIYPQYHFIENQQNKTVTEIPDAAKCIDANGNYILVRRLYEGSTPYVDINGNGRLDGTIDASGKFLPDINEYSETDEINIYSLGVPGESIKEKSDLNNDGTPDDRIINPFPGPYADTGAYDMSGKRLFKYEISYATAPNCLPTDIANHQRFFVDDLLDIGSNKDIEDRTGVPVRGPLAVLTPAYVRDPNADQDPSLLNHSQIRKCDTAMARIALENALTWARLYTANNPYDYSVPRPLNRLVAWDRPLYQFDLFNQANNARRPKRNLLDASIDMHPIIFPSQWSLAPTGAVRIHDTFEQFFYAKSPLDPTADRNGNRTPFPQTSPAPTTTYSFKDILRLGTPSVAMQNVDSSSINKLPEGFWSQSGQNSNTTFAGDVRYYFNTIYGYRTNEKRHNQEVPSISSDATTLARSTPFPSATTNPPQSLLVPRQSAFEEHITVTKPFDVRDRCRQLVFWAVDWKSYEDAESISAAPVDASYIPLRRNSSMEIKPDRNVMRNSHPPEQQLSWLSSARDNTVGNNLRVMDYDLNEQLFDNRPGLTWVPISLVTDTDKNPRFGRGDLDGRNFWAYFGHFGADRNGNGTFDRGPIKASTRLRAIEVGRFVYYDPILWTALRH